MRFHSRVLLVVLPFVVLFATAHSVRAQGYGRVEQTDTNLGTYYYLVEGTEPTVQVSVLGDVAHPGLYEMSQVTALGKLLTLTGPDVGNAQTYGRGLNRKRTMVRLYRQETAGEPTLVFESRIEDVLLGAAPPLQDGDVIMVHIRGVRLDWRDVLRIGQAAAVFILLGERIGRLF